MNCEFQYLDSEQVPPREHIKHRTAELECLTDALTPDCEAGIVHGFVCVTGPPGSGKSMLINQALNSDELAEARTARLDCWHHQNLNDVIYSITQRLYPEHIVHRNATPRATVLNRLEQNDDAPRIVVLDSANHIPTDEVFYTLSELPNLLTVCVCPDWDAVCNSLDAQIQSRIRVQEQLVLEGYHRDELHDILRARATAAFGEIDTQVTDAQLERIAAAADGDARVAIDTLCAAAERAARDDRECVTDGDVSAALPVGSDVDVTRDQNDDTLPSHHEILWGIVDKEGPIAPGELYDLYRQRVKSPRTKRTVRKYLRELEDQNSLIQRGDGPAARWRVHPSESGSGVD